MIIIFAQREAADAADVRSMAADTHRHTQCHRDF